MKLLIYYDGVLEVVLRVDLALHQKSYILGVNYD